MLNNNKQSKRDSSNSREKRLTFAEATEEFNPDDNKERSDKKKYELSPS
jgi:hypothetical protein